MNFQKNVNKNIQQKFLKNPKKLIYFHLKLTKILKKSQKHRQTKKKSLKYTRKSYKINDMSRYQACKHNRLFLFISHIHTHTKTQT